MADLDALFDQAHSSSGPTDPGRITPANNQLDDVFDSVHGNSNQASAIGSYVGEGIKQFGAGSVEGTGGFLGFLSDINPASMPEKLSGMITDAVTGENQDRGIFDRMFSNSKQIKGITDSILPKTDNGYSRMVGNFVGPQILMGLAGKAAAIPALAEQMGARALTSATSAGVAARGAEDMFPNNPVVPLIASILGGLAPGVATDTAKGIYSLLRNSTPAEIEGSAALALNRAVPGLEVPAIPDDALMRGRSTAEVTGNANMAQLERTLGSQPENAQIYNQRELARQAERARVIDSLSPVEAVNTEGAGAAMIDQARGIKQTTSTAAEDAWGLVNKKAPIGVKPAIKAVNKVIADSEGHIYNSRLQSLVDEFADPLEQGIHSAGKLKRISKDVGDLFRMEALTSNDKNIGATLRQAIDDSLEKGLTGDDLKAYRAANRLSEAKLSTFNEGPGATLTARDAEPSKVIKQTFKGDTNSAYQTQTALGWDTEAIDIYKRGILNELTGEYAPRLTTDRVRKFIAANEGGLNSIFGEEGLADFRRVWDDLASKDSVAEMATRATAKGSATSQNVTVAGKIRDMILGSIIPDSGRAKQFVDYLRGSLNARNEESVNRLLFQATLNPEIARDLAQSASPVRIMGGLERLGQMFKNAAKSGAREGAVEASRPSGGAETKLPTPQPTPKKKPDILGSLSDFIVPEAQASTPEEDMPLTDQPVNLPKILNAIKHVESRGKTDATSSVGAKGQYQLMDATGREWHKKLGIKEAYNPRDPAQSRKIAGAYVKFLIDYYDGDVTKAVTAYHTGIGNVDKNKIGPRGKEYAGLVEKAYDKL